MKFSTQHSALSISSTRRGANMRRGFTLIELSIVLVIIGLIVGGIMVGKDLIEASTIRAEISQIDSFRAAENTFRLKYNGLPGDILMADKLGLGLPYHPGANGQYIDGNGMLNGNGLKYGFPYNESTFYFVDMGSVNCTSYAQGITGKGAGLLAAEFKRYLCGSTGGGAGVNYYVGEAWPRSKINPQFGIIPVTASQFDGGLWYILNGSSAGNWLSNYATTPSLTPTQAFSLDAKIDNGIPSSGSVRAFRVVWQPNPIGDEYVLNDVTANSCITDAAGSAYNTTNSNILCRIIVKK